MDIGSRLKADGLGGNERRDLAIIGAPVMAAVGQATTVPPARHSSRVVTKWVAAMGVAPGGRGALAGVVTLPRGERWGVQRRVGEALCGR